MSRLCQIRASAGSGKTHELTRRYLDRLCKCLGSHAAPGNPAGAAASRPPFGNIVAITFTNAAVEEMRSRVLGDLKKAALGKPEPENLEGVDRERALACLEALLQDLGQLNVRTIDSLLHQIVRTAALSLGLHPDFQPAFDAAEALAPYLERFMRRAEAGDEAALAQLEKAVKAYLAHLARKGDKKFLPGRDLLSDINPYLDDVFREQAGQQANDAGGDERLRAQPAKLATVMEIRESLERLEKKSTETAQRLLDELERQHDSCGIKLHGNARKVIAPAAAGEFKASDYNKKASVRELLTPKSPLPDEMAQLEELYADYKSAINNFFKVQKLLAEYPRFYPLIELARMLVTEHDADRQKGNTLPSSLIPLLATRALAMDTGVCEGICRLGSRLNDFLWDEFQDTNLEQWQAVLPLLEEALASGGSLTWVGDVKQSIFGWRGGNPELFDAPPADLKHMTKEEQRNTLTLKNNWRSARQIIEHNNMIFEQLNNADTAASILKCLLPKDFEVTQNFGEEVAKNFGDAHQEIPARAQVDGYVRLEVLGKNLTDFKDAFSKRLPDFLQNELRPANWSDILILVRDNDTVTDLAALLLSQNIPVITEKSLLLAGHYLIEESVALLELIANPRNEQALHLLLTGAICGGHEAAQAHAAELAECALHRRKEQLAARKEDPDARQENLKDYVRRQYPALWEELFGPFLYGAKTLTPYDAIREWYRKMKVEQRFPEERIFLRSFLQLLHGAELRGIVSVNEFLDFWQAAQEDDKTAPRAHMPDGLDAVRIMTIHKAKGLQAPVVILPLPAGKLKPNSNKSHSIVPINVDGLTVSVPLVKEYTEERNQALMREALEALNLIYVAYTRPKEALYIFTTDEPGSPLATLAERAGLGCPYSYGVEPQPGAAPADPADTDQPVAPAASAAVETEGTKLMDWLPRLRIAKSWPVRAGRDQKAGKGRQNSFNAKQRGTLLHFCLEHMRIGESPEEAAREALAFGLAQSGPELQPSREERQKMLESLCWFAGQKEAAAWLEKGLREQPLLDRQGKERRVDLLVPQDWGALVIDYKSGEPEAENETQMREYMGSLEAADQFPGLIRGLLVYIDQRKFHLIAGPEAPVESADCPSLP